MNVRIALAIEILLIVWPGRKVLIGARWTAAAPRTAIVLWQALVVGTAVAALGGCLVDASSTATGGPWHAIVSLSRSLLTARATKAMTPNELFGLTAGLIAATVIGASLLVRSVGLVRATARYRVLVDLVGEERAEAPGALVIDHATPAAYCVPGRRGRIVISSGALVALSNNELGAVLAHERAHMHARHDLALLPFRSIAAALPGSRAAALVNESVRGLVELAADDRAMRECGRRELARALCRLSVVDLPDGVLGAAAVSTLSRVDRALSPRRSGIGAVVGGSVASLVAIALPLATVLVAFGGR